MKPPTVLQLGTSGPLYGAERWILALTRNLDAALIDSRIAVIDDTLDGVVPLATEAEKLGLPAYRIQTKGRFSTKAVQALRQLLSDQAIDIVHSHGYKADVTALLAARGTSVKTITTPHGWSYDAGLKLRLYEAIDRFSFRYFDAVVPLSEHLHGPLASRRSLSDKLHLISNGVDLQEVDGAGPTPNALPEVLAARKQTGPVIGYVGQLIERKNLAVLLKAFAQWDRSDASLILVGEGDQEADLRQKAASLGIAEQTLFAGFRQDRLEWIRGFDAFVLPSRMEGTPRCLMEALALAVPVIASDIPGNRDLIQADQAGWLFPPSDVNRLVSLFDQAIDPIAGSARSATGRKMIEEHHSARAMAQSYENLFIAVLGK